MQICTVPTVLTARRQLAAARYVEVAEWLSAANKVENLDLGCLRDGESSAAAMPPQLQYRIRGALNAAGFESTGRKISSGDYKGVTAFARVQREQE